MRGIAICSWCVCGREEKDKLRDLEERSAPHSGSLLACAAVLLRTTSYRLPLPTSRLVVESVRSTPVQGQKKKKCKNMEHIETRGFDSCRLFSAKPAACFGPRVITSARSFLPLVQRGETPLMHVSPCLRLPLPMDSGTELGVWKRKDRTETQQQPAGAFYQ